MIKTIVIDDQLQPRRFLLRQLATIKEVEVIAEAGSAEQGEELIKKLRPDLVFLDVEMPSTTGFEMLRHFTAIDFEIIFISCYPKYAIEAIKEGALDYLLKPIKYDELNGAIIRCKEKIDVRKRDVNDIKVRDADSSRKLLLPLPKGYKLISIFDIVYCESSGRYTIFHPYNDNFIVVAKNLGSFHESLVAQGFVRIHDSYMINMHYFDSYSREREKYGEVVLITGVKLKVSRTRKTTLLKELRQYKIKD